MVLDFSDLTRSEFLLAPGISENPLSHHYSDLFDDWRNFRWMTVAHDRIVDTLVLTPSTSNAD